MTEPARPGLADDGGEGGVDGELEGKECVCVCEGWGEEEVKDGGAQAPSLVMRRERCIFPQLDDNLLPLRQGLTP